MMLRAVPDLTDFRPADANETAAAGGWRWSARGRCFFALTRQDLPVIDAAKHDVYAGVSKGAYVLEDAANPQVILIGTGSEVWPGAGRGEAAGGARESRARGEHAELEDFRGADRRSTRRACCRRACRRWRWKRARRWAGGSMWAGTATWLGWIALARRLRGRWCWRSLDSRAENVAARAKELLKK